MWGHWSNFGKVNYFHGILCKAWKSVLFCFVFPYWWKLNDFFAFSTAEPNNCCQILSPMFLLDFVFHIFHLPQNHCQADNHRNDVWRGSLNQLSTQSMLIASTRSVQPELLKTPSDGNPTALWESLFQCCTALLVKKLLLMSNLNLPMCHYSAFCPFVWICDYQEEFGYVIFFR